MKNKTKLSIIKMEEESVNTLVFAAWIIVTVGAFIGVVCFMGGGIENWMTLAVAAIGIIFRIFEKKTEWFKKYAKYAYMTLPFWCTWGLILDDEGRFAATTQAWFLYLALSIAYYDVKMVLFCAMVTIVSTILSFALSPQAMLELDNATVWFYILALYVVEIIFCSLIANRMRRLLKKARQMKSYEDELIYLEQLEKKDEKYSEFIHNINHYFMAIGELARVEHCDQIVSMIEELKGNVIQNERIIYTGHKVLNAILSEKVNEASELRIEFDVYVEPVISLEDIANGDLVAMISNLLDNAVEAACECELEKRKIRVRIYMEKKGKVCVVKVDNYFVGSRVLHNSLFMTTKKDKEMHGIGVKSVKTTAQKYRGHLQCIIEDEKFTAILILPSKQQKTTI